MTRGPRSSSFEDLAACLRGEPPAGVDWIGVTLEANHRLVAPALYAALRRNGDLAALPAELVEYLRLLHDLNGERNARLKAQAHEALGALNAVGIEPLLLKGAGFVLTAPPDRLGERMMSDLDLMVAPDRLTDAMSQLFALGYEVLSSDVGPHAQASLFRAQDPGSIDLHLRPPGPADLYEDGGGRADERHEFDSVRARLPSPTDRALHLIVHDMMHDGRLRGGSIELRHLLDLRDLAAGPLGVDWDAIRRKLQSLSSPWAFELSILNLRELLHVEIPDAGDLTLFTRVLYRRQMLKIRRPWFRIVDDLVVPLVHPGWRWLSAATRRRR